MAAYNCAIENRLLIQFSQVGCCSTTIEQEVRCINTLVQDGLVSATVLIDDANRKYSAEILRLTECGLKRVDGFSSTSEPTPAITDEELGVKGQLEADDGFDRTLLKIASGGIVIAFGLVPLMQSVAVVLWQFWVWLGAVLAFGFSLLGLLYSYRFSKAAFRSVAIGKPSEAMANATANVNKLNGLLFIVGFVLLGVFVGSVLLRFVK